MKIILREDQLESLISSLPDFEDDDTSSGQTCRCKDFSLFYGCTDCFVCCRDNGGPNQDSVAPITGMGTVTYSYDPGEIATTNSSSSFGYVKT